MADESRARSGDGRSRRRRYFKRRGDSTQGEDGARERPSTAAESKRSESARPDAAREVRPEFRVAHEDASGAARNRNLRKRRRSRARRSDQPAGVAPAAERDEPYAPPQTVSIYEHVVRQPASNYEYRADPFSKTGRTLEDYSLDLSPVFNPAPREPVGQVIARVFAEYEAADAIEAARSGIAPRDEDEEPTPLTSGPGAGALGPGSGSDANPWAGRDANMAAAEAAIEAADEAQEPPPNN